MAERRSGRVGQGAATAGPSLEDKIAFLSRPATWRDGEVVVRETRTSFVFLVGERVYKLKRPIADGDLDFRSLAARRRNAEAEVRLNRRLAPDVYIGTAPLVAGTGGLSVGGEGTPVDWLVAMRRLPADGFLDRAIATGRATPEAVTGLGRRLAAFYGALPPERPDAAAHLGAVRDSLALARARLADPTFGLDPARLDRLEARMLALLAERSGEIEDRLRAGVHREGHGDLRPEHVFLGDPPAVIDCLEFSARLRVADPFDEVGYLGLECERLGAPWIAPLLLQALDEGFGHRPSADLLAFHRAHRAVLRARFALRHLLDPVPREPAKWPPQAQAYLRIAEVALGLTRP